jgi:cytochrome c biogenesis factor
VTAVSVEVSRGGRPATLLVARQLAYGDPDNSRATTPTPELAEPGVAHSLLGDLRIVTESTDGDAARVRVSLVPLVWMFWLGALLTVVGGAAGLVFEAGASPATEGA